ncbi:hypothetical protein [Ulvibacter litoralis]|uniref:RNA polymerase sigma factor, sigma-70 family n=1 Tax=Ulvibacter litoralis TaxID=227084 RepID=A0A1G7EWR7_9FLAO|nr:hypothetical protein [Ulvibacter litoralis]GHC53678.1 hypothetical protein GCM10008083_17210 [Ulvibacter litoralis]SDE67886.1 RNA polymerase sigma factor, sigma-70 family [Ulvibacter litoralis]
MKTTSIYLQRQQEIRLSIEKTFPDFIKLKKEGDQASFNKNLLEILPEVKKYINQRLAAAIKKGDFSKGKYKADDFIDQLFIEIYDAIDEVKEAKDFYLWLFKKTNELLDDAIVEEEFNDLFFKNIDDYSKPEWDEMTENYSTDGDGDLLMIEELDDSSYNHNDYLLNHVFITNQEKKLTDKIDKDLNDDAVNRHVAMVLQNVPAAMRDVFLLATNHQFSVKEIAVIKNRSYEEVEKLLNNARKAIQVSLLNRYSIK